MTEALCMDQPWLPLLKDGWGRFKITNGPEITDCHYD